MASQVILTIESPDSRQARDEMNVAAHTSSWGSGLQAFHVCTAQYKPWAETTGVPFFESLDVSAARRTLTMHPGLDWRAAAWYEGEGNCMTTFFFWSHRGCCLRCSDAEAMSPFGLRYREHVSMMMVRPGQKLLTYLRYLLGT